MTSAVEARRHAALMGKRPSLRKAITIEPVFVRSAKQCEGSPAARGW